MKAMIMLICMLLMQGMEMASNRISGRVVVMSLIRLILKVAVEFLANREFIVILLLLFMVVIVLRLLI